MKLALDTNVLVYAEGLNGPDRHNLAKEIIQPLRPAETAIPLQVLGELFNVLVRKGQMARTEARTRVVRWSDTFLIVETSSAIFQDAIDLATYHQLVVWDAVVVSAASHAGCRILLSEDMQDGFTWGGVTVVNPFALSPHPLLEAFLTERG